MDAGGSHRSDHPQSSMRLWVLVVLGLVMCVSPSEGFKLYDGYYNSLFRPVVEQSFKAKVETLGAILKRHVQQLRSTENRQVDLVFLVDSSASVGGVDFKEEIKFVRKLLADFTVDLNTTRVAIITFSSREKVVRQVDHLTRPHRDHHKCSLLTEEVPRIKYVGGGTYTLGAFLEAKRVLRAARPDAVKAVFLITDGFSNGGDPRPEARRLRQQGVKVFTFGIRNGNVRELWEMASEPRNETCYILDSFEEFEALARRALHSDLHSGTYVPQALDKCNRLCGEEEDCCHDNSTCMCGTHTGKYKCLCKPGYYGTGLGKDGCKPCPSGTYKNYTGSGDVAACTPCPDENQETPPGATLVHECKCKRGFRNFNSSECTVFRCPELREPDNGYFVNNQCNNVFNAACGLRCRPGYELRGSGLRICQEDGSWSGQNTKCVLKTCPALPAPKNGHMVCTTDDFRFPTVCRFTCQGGYQLLGSRKRSCLAIAFWTGIAARCREITCPPIPEIRDGSIQPALCTEGEVPFGTTCQLSCVRGYKLRGPAAKQCTPDGTWSSVSREPNQCVDNTPPYIQCPENIEITADPENVTTEVTWAVPVAVDNSGFIPVLTSDPAVVPPAHFPIGFTVVTYRAEDLSENVAKCKFYILVVDETPPQIDQCFSPDPVVSADGQSNVTWEEPIFSDNSGLSVEVQSSHSPGELFPQGRTTVTYTAIDGNGNNNTCIIEVEVSPHPCQYPDPPVNGERECQESEDGVHCVLSCHPGYAFVTPPPEEYFCAYDNVWTPADHLPFPDCAAQHISNEVLQPASITLTGDLSCADHKFLNRVEQNIEAKVNDKISSLCEEDIACDLEEIQTTCDEDHEDFNKISVVPKRLRRSADRIAKRRRQPTASLKFDFTLEGTVNSSGSLEEASRRQEELSKSMKRLLQGLQTQAKQGHFDVYLAGRWLRFSDMDFDDRRQRKSCPQGSVLLDNSCVLCPVGMFYNVVSHQCRSCPQGTYQQTEGRLACMVCPEKTNTSSQNARSQQECRAQCLPGSVSPTGLEQCETCHKGFYQPQYAQVTCIPCPDGSTTQRRGARGKDQCREHCPEGQVSRTGLQPCYLCPHGTYQPQGGQTVCIKCPAGADTDRRAATSITQCLGYEEVQSDDAGAVQNEEQQLLDANPCFSNPCQNGGTCTLSEGGLLFLCKCPPGFEGVFCSTLVDHCEAAPCLNGGTCTSLPGTYQCDCKPGFEGQKCERDLDECESSPCGNGGTCVDGANSFTCNCPNGFQGVTCESDINDCADQPCLNGGSCQDDVSGYRCACPEGFTGTTCEIETDECLSAPCENGGTCVDEPSDFRCECPGGYTGKQCEKDINECSSDPCLNGAKCEDLVDAYKCHCNDGFTGRNCESELSEYYQLDFPTASTVDYAMMSIDRPLTALTVSFWMLSDDVDNYGTTFSYAVPNMDNALSLTDYNGFAFYVNQESVITDVATNDGYWHHVVITWSSNRGNWKIYVDGLLNDSGFDLSTARPVPGKGTLVIGQEQDSMGGGFSANEAFVGTLTLFNMWDEELSLSTIESMRVSCREFHGNIISWPDVQGSLKGSLSPQPSPFCQECPVPPDVEFGSVSYSALTPGSEITYSCQRGFNVAGPPSTVCLVTGEYELPPPSCQRVDCGHPGSIDNGYFNEWRFHFDSRVRFRCQRGYKIQGSETLYCNEYGEWEGDLPECVEITCALPQLSENTLLTPPRDAPFKPGERASFGCSVGHKLLTNHDSVVCQNDGTWDRSVPTCDPQTCSSPPFIPFGEPDTALEEYNVGEIVRYTCEFGYTLNQQSGNPTGALSCLPSGQWESPEPECVPVTCDEPPLVAYASMEGEERTFLSTVTYQCNPGYASQGDGIIECLETGDWDPEPPRCEPVNCGQPPDLPNGNVEGSDFSFKAVVTCSCLPGYKLVGNMRRRCNESGLWHGPDPVCKPVTCGRLSDPNHGTVNAPDITFQSEATYTCDEGYTLSGDVSRTCTAESRWSGEQPQCQPVTCEDLPDIPYGSFQGPAAYTFGARVVYSCQQGYTVEGEAELECTSSGKWSHEVPVCYPAECPLPTSPEHGSFTMTGITFESTVEFTCYIGFRLDGQAVRKCEADGTWSGEKPVCVSVTCDPPPEIPNGQYDYKDLKIGSIVRYTCNKGYRLEGYEVRRCQSNLTLTGSEPTCTSIVCPAPNPPLHGSVTLSDPSLIVGTTATFACHLGYYLRGEEALTCGTRGVFIGTPPRCPPVECDKPAEIISNGRMLGTTFTFNSTVSYECDEGYRMEGEPERTCQANRQWDRPIPVCIVVECPRPSLVNGFASTFRREFGTIVTFSCRPRHRLEGPSERTCMADGVWSGDDPVCVKIVCPPPLSLDNGVSRQTNDVTLTYSCNIGYRLEGSNTSTCNSKGLWEPAAPTCVLITCPDISSVTLLNGIVIFSENLRNYGSQIQYQCNSGYTLMGASQRSCTLSGQWEGEAPTCEIISCLQPSSILNGSVFGDVFTFGSDIGYECDEGHNLVGLAVRRCQADGSWEGEDPQCEPVECPELDAVLENGVVTYLSNTFGSQVRYSCYPGFMLQGTYVRNCTASGEWSDAKPVCLSLECAPPPPIERGTIVGDDYTIGRSVMYSCEKGYQPVGSTVLVCLPNLMWSGLAPVCERVSCPKLPPLQFGTAVGEGHRYGDGILFVCDPGYELIGHFSRSCQADGTWDGELPECAPVSCGLPPMIDHAMPDLTNGTLFPAVISYKCDVGYRPQGNEIASCLGNGSWSVPNFSCQLITCPEIRASYLQNGQVLGDDFSFGKVISFVCNIGYRLEGSDNATCLAEGIWDAELPICQLMTCQEPEALTHSTVTVQGYNYDETATYECITGYELKGVATARCTESGEWSKEYRECFLVVCESPPLAIPNGHLLGEKISYVYQDLVEYQCDRGFELVGTGQLTCSADGIFVPSVPTCSKIQCPSPGTPQNGNVQIINDTLLYSCIPGYELAGLPQRRCLETGQWEGVAPVCIAILCPPPVPISNGHITGNDFQFGNSVTYTCDAGFTLQGDAIRTCMAFRAWSGIEPVCHRVSCGPPHPIEHGSVLADSFLFKDTISYECQLGFALVGQRERVCLESATWSGDDPYCDEIMCEYPPDIINATHDAESPSNSHFSFGSLVMYMCDVGHFMSGSSSILCQEDGTWSQPFPQCPPVVCQPLPALEHGSMTGDDHTFGGEFLFECDEGYRLEGPDSLVCMEDGLWDDAVPVCVQIVCQAPVVEHGLVLLSGQGENELPPATFLPGDVAMFRCVPGYLIGGSTDSRCLKDGQWTNRAPTCLPVICGPPPAIFHAQTSAVGPHYAGDTVSYSCVLGFELEGEATLLCDDSGSWVGTHPQCIDVVCEDPPFIENAQVVGHDFSRSWSTPAGGWIQYECQDGFMLEEGQDGRLACHRGGSWSADLPRCIHIDCGPLSVPSNAWVSTTGSTAGSLATVTCNVGHYLPDGSQQMEMVCDISGSWAGAGDVHCGPVDCSQPPQIPNTSPLGSISTMYKSQVSYQCLPGYQLSGHRSLQCSEDGSWVSLGDQVPVCDPVDCGVPQTNMDIVGSEFTFGSSLTLTCPEGMRAVGSEKVTCLSDGQWSPEPGRCEKIRCPPVEMPAQGYTLSRNDEVGSRLEIICQEGYQVQGDSVLTCLSNGSWDLPLPTCHLLRDVDTMCVKSVSKEKVVVPPGDHFPGDRAALSCRPGYQPEGDMTSLCLDDRTWTEPVGECRRLSCGPPPVEDRHRVKVFGRSYLYGDRVMYMCRRGMAPARVPPALICTDTGEWDGVAACVAQCKQPCLNGGRCVGLNKCKCVPGYTGRQCQIPICILPCLNGGKCQAPYRCKCQQGYYGSRCHKAVCNQRCENGGRCLHPNRCQCFHGFRPPFCRS